LTGSAGTGKTFLLNKYITYLRERGVKPAIVAPTGIAASHLGGTTIHSFFGIGLQEEVSDEHVNDLLYRKYLHNRLKKLQVLIIDEVSMVSPQLFESIDKILRAFKYSREPFGGVQIILAGDFFQLPPVSTSGQEVRFAWQTALWQNSNLRVCYLEEKYRQDDLELINILDEIRSGEVSEESWEVLRSCYRREIDGKFKITRLYTHNVDVDRINKEELAKITDEPVIFEAQTKGAKKQVEKIFNGSLVAEQVEMKKGAVVIFIKNNFEKGYTNGTLGRVVDFTDENHYKGAGWPVVEIFSGEEIVVDYEDWVIENDKGEVKASVRQIPLRLAWAITIHKSQGMTLDAAEIDLSKTFEVGQGYVALSRIKSVEGLRLLGMNEVALQVDPLVAEADGKMKQLSNLNVRKWESFTKEEKEKMFRDFILKAGGTVTEEEIRENKKKLAEEEKAKREFFAKQSRPNLQNSDKQRGKNGGRQRGGGLTGQRGGTLLITKQYLEQKKSLEEIAQERGMALRTIQGHLDQIKQKWPEVDIEYLKPEEKLLKKVEKVVREIRRENNPDDFYGEKQVRLRAIYERLGEKVSYEDIKLALLFV